MWALKELSRFFPLKERFFYERELFSFSSKREVFYEKGFFSLMRVFFNTKVFSLNEEFFT